MSTPEDRIPPPSREDAARTDTQTHEDLLGPDLDKPLPPEAREIVAEQARRMGLDPDKAGLR